MTQPAKRSFKRKFRVCYPPGTGTLVIRTELDWERDVHPIALSSDGCTARFEIEAQQPFVHFKPCLIKKSSLHWAVGTNNLLIMAGDDDRVVYPFFFATARAVLAFGRSGISYPSSTPPPARLPAARLRGEHGRALPHSPTCRTDRTCFFPTRHFSTRIGA